jgi:uncharacterized protein (TIGR03790 family)
MHMRFMMLIWLTCVLTFPARAASAPPEVPQSLGPHQVALVVNLNDPASVETAAYYQKQRRIPAANVVRVRFRADVSMLSELEYASLYKEVSRKTPAHVQAYALAWTQPYRVGCMGITSAFAFGYDPAWCAAGCGATRASPYFNTPGIAPWSLHRMRPAMLLAGRSVAEVKALIDRGVAADHTFPYGTAYLVSTDDKARNVRASLYPTVTRLMGSVLSIATVDPSPARRDDVLAYFTGLVRVPGLDQLHFRPGAVADHLTSTAGKLTDSTQMSALEWLTAGATGSYGTVVEPCNHPNKFPNPGIFLSYYLGGATLLEAYWKSVAWPGQGVFIGEPLARPYGARWIKDGHDGWALEAYTARPQQYEVSLAPSVVGPFRSAGALTIDPGPNRIPLPRVKGVLRFTPVMPKPSAAAPATRD